MSALYLITKAAYNKRNLLWPFRDGGQTGAAAEAIRNIILDPAGYDSASGIFCPGTRCTQGRGNTL
jgi:hypothetical protein